MIEASSTADSAHVYTQALFVAVVTDGPSGFVLVPEAVVGVTPSSGVVVSTPRRQWYVAFIASLVLPVPAITACVSGVEPITLRNTFNVCEPLVSVLPTCV